jgi:ribosomal protein RSM22 (predicted rRNA methylase)
MRGRPPPGRPRPGAVHEGLVGPRALVGSPYLADPALRAEYETDIAPRTRAALARIFGELSHRLARSETGVRRVLDLGAGTGAAGQAVKQALASPSGALATNAHRAPGELEIVSVDRVAAMPGVIVSDLRSARRPRGVEGQFDLIVAAHLLNELATSLSVAELAGLVFFWGRELLAPGGHIVLVEPALKQTSRQLLAVRDRLVGAGFFVVAPCFWQGPCPALARERDWCHAATAWSPSDPAEAARRAGRSRVDYSYLVLGWSPGSTDRDLSRDRRMFRVVSDPMVEKGRLRLFGCGPAGRLPLVRLDRDRSETNRGFDEAERGDVIVAADTQAAGDGLRIGPTSRVERRRG